MKNQLARTSLSLALFASLSLHCADSTPAPAVEETPPEIKCDPITGTGTTHDQPVEADETWTAKASPHIVTTSVFVRNGATLTIEPCAEVRLAEDQSIEVASVPTPTTGTLLAEGTANTPIRFTGNNGERWGYIFVRAGSGTVKLRHVVLEGGGGDLQTMHSTLFVRGQSAQPSPRTVLVDHVVIKDSVGYGVVFDRAAGFADGSTDLTITNSGKGDVRYPFPLSVGEQAVGTVPTGTYTGNAIDEILITEDPVNGRSGLQENATMRDRGVPYRIGQNTNKQMRVENATLTIEAGVTLRFEPNAGFEVHHLNADEVAGAAIVAVGTAEKPIVFTSASATPAPGDWVGIWFGGNPLGTNRLDHVKIDYAGGDCACGFPTCSNIADHDAAIMFHYAPAPGFSITNTTFSNSARHAINRGWQGTSTQSFLGSNTFTNIAECNETLPVPDDGTCPGGPQPCN